jgi:hypothetical protein
MAQTYTLEEAAEKLGISVSDFKRRLQSEWKHIVPMRDGPTLRFRANQIEEIIREIGGGSSGSMEMLNLDDSETLSFQPDSSPVLGESSGESPLLFADDAISMSDDDINLVDDQPKSKAKSGSDSDVRLEKEKKRKPVTDDDESILGTEEISLDIPASSLSARMSGKSGKITGASSKSIPAPEEDSSEFELQLEPNSSSEFELSLNADSSSEIDIGVAGARGNNSGINLDSPVDSGISLENKDSSEEFELTLDSEGSSEFELSLDGDTGATSDNGESQGDIFETDFEIPALDAESGSEVVALEESDTDLENSDFDLEMASDSDAPDIDLDVVEEEAPRPKSRLGKTGRAAVASSGDSFDDVDLDEELTPSRVLRGSADDDLEYDEDDRGRAEPAEWGGFPVAMSLLTMPLMFLGLIVAYESMHSLWGYQQSSRTTTMVVDSVAEMFGFGGKK